MDNLQSTFEIKSRVKNGDVKSIGIKKEGWGIDESTF